MWQSERLLAHKYRCSIPSDWSLSSTVCDPEENSAQTSSYETSWRFKRPYSTLWMAYNAWLLLLPIEHWAYWGVLITFPGLNSGWGLESLVQLLLCFTWRELVCVCTWKALRMRLRSEVQWHPRGDTGSNDALLTRADMPTIICSVDRGRLYTKRQRYRGKKPNYFMALRCRTSARNETRTRWALQHRR